MIPELTSRRRSVNVAMQEEVRLLFVINSLGPGGAERMLLKLVTTLGPRFRPTVVSLMGRGMLADEFERVGVPVLTVDMRGPMSMLRALIELRGHILEFNPHVVCTWLYHADLVGGLAARLAGHRAIAWNIRNSTLSREGSKRSTRAIVKLNARLSRFIPSSILCCSSTAQRVHIELGYDGSRFTLIPNGFDVARYRPDPAARESVRAELGIASDAPVIGLVARWDPQKNHRGFVEAATLLAAKRPDARFVLAGLGCDPANRELVDLIARHGLTSAFRLLGSRDDVARLTTAFDVATLCSLFGEAFPNALGEAMACAVPCVATDVGDSAYVIGNSGIVVPLGDAAALVAGWDEILAASPQRRQELGMAARERVTSLFEIGAVTRLYETQFLALAGADR